MGYQPLGGEREAFLAPVWLGVPHPCPSLVLSVPRVIRLWPGGPVPLRAGLLAQQLGSDRT